MISNLFAYYKHKLPNWLLTAGIFLGLFIFPGYTGNPLITRQQPTQTELVFSNNCKIAKRTIAYNRTLTSACKNKTFNNTRKYEAIALLTSNRLIKVKLDNIFKLFYSGKIACWFIQIKRIPQSSNEDLPALS
jgi:hypothetical protein